MCGSVVRPDVVLFGEALPSDFWTKASTDFPTCDLLIVLGTSLTVAPFNSLVTKPGRSVPRVYVSKSKPGAAGGFLPWLMGLGGNVNFSRSSDLIVQDDCDQTVRKLCRLVGWEEELDALPYDIMEP